LKIGAAFRGAIVRQHHVNAPSTWLATINASYVGQYPDRAPAMKHVEENIRHDMQLVLHDWDQYQAAYKAE
jgi:hypothetical protein